MSRKETALYVDQCYVPKERILAVFRTSLIGMVLFLAIVIGGMRLDGQTVNIYGFGVLGVLFVVSLMSIMIFTMGGVRTTITPQGVMISLLRAGVVIRTRKIAYERIRSIRVMHPNPRTTPKEELIKISERIGMESPLDEFMFWSMRNRDGTYLAGSYLLQLKDGDEDEREIPVLARDPDRVVSLVRAKMGEVTA